MEEDSYEKDVLFYVNLEEPKQIGDDAGLAADAEKKRPDELTEDEKFALLGRPKLGDITRAQIRVKESKEFKNTVDKLVQRANASILIGTSSWKEQFIEAITVSAGDEGEGEEGEDGEVEEKMPSCGDYVMHFLTLFWKILFAFVPPTDMANGYVTFVVSIMSIGMVTAFIGDIASHFGCTVGVKDAVTAVAFVALGTSVPDIYEGYVTFVVSILGIGALTAVIGDVASHFGCTLGIVDGVTAIAFVALGTSVPDIYEGYVTFVVSILGIGMLTAVIGDIASHFGCTLGVKDGVTAIAFVALGTSVPDHFGGWLCFNISIMWVGILTAVIGDVASHFGCTVGLKDGVTAITFVALGTSVPDTFASKVAAIQDKYADASVGNVTGSNAVNVFLGIGIAWSIAAIYHAMHGRAFEVDPGNLAFSVTLFCSEALIAIAILLMRRCKAVGGELGGPAKYKYPTSCVLFGLWVFYIVMSSLEAYDVIEGF